MYFDTTVLVQYWPLLLKGFSETVIIVVVALTGGAVLGLVVALLNLSSLRAANWFGRAYVNCFRAAPEMVVIFWAYFCLPQILDLRLSAFFTGVLALVLVASANLGEIFRAGILAVPRGQTEAALVLGLSPLQRLALVILPQAVKRMLGPLVNYLTELLKHSTLLSAIGVTEIAHSAFTLGSQTFRYLEFLTTVGVIFFIVIFPLSLLGRKITRRNAENLGG